MNLSQLVKSILDPTPNCALTTFRLCKQLNVPVTKSNIVKDLEEHPDYPSLVAVKDILNDIGIESLPLSTVETEELSKLSMPAIAQIKLRHHANFVVITSATIHKVQYFHHMREELITVSLENFSQLFTGFILLVEPRDASEEKNYAIHYRNEKRQYLKKMVGFSAIPAFTFVTSILVYIQNGIASLQAITFTLLTLMGALAGTLLLWYEVDQYNHTLKQICSTGKKTNCAAILHSKASKIFGISWSVIGFTYFAGSLISLLITGIYQTQNLFILSWLNVLSLPYIAFSIYYQAKVAKQWCILCLSVQAILGLQFLVALWGRFHNIEVIHPFTSSIIASVILSFIMPFLIVRILLPVLRKNKESKNYIMELQKLKHNPQIFEALLNKQKPISNPTEGLGISIGDPTAPCKVVKVCNPYCSPCAKAHPAIEYLLENNKEVQIQIIFTAYGNEFDIATPITKHLLAIAEKNDPVQTKKSLDDWYLSRKKDYADFASKHPVNGDLNQQNKKIAAMRQWCDKEEITFTPLFIVNGYRLPDLYTVADLKYFHSA